MPRSSTPIDSDTNSGKKGATRHRHRSGSPTDTYLNYPGHGGALLPGVLQHMRDEFAPVEKKARPTDIEKYRAADIKVFRNAVAKLGRIAADTLRPQAARFLISLDRFLTAPSERKGPPQS